MTTTGILDRGSTWPGGTDRCLRDVALPLYDVELSRAAPLTGWELGAWAAVFVNNSRLSGFRGVR